MLQRRIRELRLQLNLTQPELAKEIGVDKTAIAHWERGKSSPRASMLPDVARALRTTIDGLYFDPGAS